MTAKDRQTAQAVMERDGWCVFCGKSDALTVHHIVPRSWQPTRYSLDNIITLCMECHDAVHRQPDQKAHIYDKLGIDEKERFKEAGYW